jgi:hypothetical protein
MHVKYGQKKGREASMTYGNKLQQLGKNIWHSQFGKLLLCSLGLVIVAGLIWGLISVTLKADTPTTASFQPEAGARTGNVVPVTDSSASAGQAVEFGQVTAPPAVVCPGEASMPDGPDPWGGCWPGPTTTGIPSGTNLTSYTGSCTITAANTVIDSRTVNCSPLTIRAANVAISKSQLNGGVNIESSYCGTASFTITDSNVDIPDEVAGNSGSTGILRCNFQANRVDVTGGRRSMYCTTNCVIENSWVHEHGVDPQAEAHFSGIRMEQNTTIRHSSITCEATRSGPGSGCSAGLTGYPDFAPVRDNLIERNLFYRGAAGGSTMCAYGGATSGKPYSTDATNATNIRFIGNRFVRSPTGYCGNLGTILHFNPARPGNVWTDNLYTDGATVSATGP